VQTILHPLLLIWLPFTVVLAIRGDLRGAFEQRLYAPKPTLNPSLYRPVVTSRSQIHNRAPLAALALSLVSRRFVIHRHVSQHCVGVVQVHHSQLIHSQYTVVFRKA
jgi:hypothetical protein